MICTTEHAEVLVQVSAATAAAAAAADAYRTEDEGCLKLNILCSCSKAGGTTSCPSRGQIGGNVIVHASGGGINCPFIFVVITPPPVNDHTATSPSASSVTIWLQLRHLPSE
jgi:hypothetical protein